MDDLEVLTRAAMLVRLWRRARDVDAVIRRTYEAFELGVPAAGASIVDHAVRAARGLDGDLAPVMRLVREELARQSEKLSLNRQAFRGEVEAAPRARALSAFVAGASEEAIILSDGRASYNVSERSCDMHPADDEAFEESLEHAADPLVVLIDYPLVVPVTFDLPLDGGYALYARACEAIASAYETIYSDPDRHGVSMHDRADLVIERLLLYPSRSLLYPNIGS